MVMRSSVRDKWVVFVDVSRSGTQTTTVDRRLTSTSNWRSRIAAAETLTSPAETCATVNVDRDVHEPRVEDELSVSSSTTSATRTTVSSPVPPVPPRHFVTSRLAALNQRCAVGSAVGVSHRAATVWGYHPSIWHQAG